MNFHENCRSVWLTSVASCLQSSSTCHRKHVPHFVYLVIHRWTWLFFKVSLVKVFNTWQRFSSPLDCKLLGDFIHLLPGAGHWSVVCWKYEQTVSWLVLGSEYLPKNQKLFWSPLNLLFWVEGATDLSLSEPSYLWYGTSYSLLDHLPDPTLFELFRLKLLLKHLRNEH